MSNNRFEFKYTASESPGLLLWQVTIIWQRIIKKVLEPHGINHSQFVILAILLWLETNEKEVNQTEIMNLSQLDKMTVSLSMRQLAAKNLIIRGESKKDTRSKIFFLNQFGKELAQKLLGLVQEADAQFFETLGKTGEKQLISLLSNLINK